MLNNLFTNTLASIDSAMVILSSLVSVLLGLIIALTYKFTTRSNKNFLITISLLPLLSQAVTLLVNGNLGMSVAVAGTFSLVRFRSIPGTSKEIISVFFAMTIGLALGVGYMVYAILLGIIGCLLILILSNLHILDKNKYERHLKITIPEDLDFTKVFDETMQKYTKNYELLYVKTIALGSMFELVYIITMKKDINQKEFIDDLRIKNGNLKIILTEPTDGMEL